jgi:hypothetical protein
MAGKSIHTLAAAISRTPRVPITFKLRMRAASTPSRSSISRRLACCSVAMAMASHSPGSRCIKEEAAGLRRGKTLSQGRACIIHARTSGGAKESESSACTAGGMRMRP